MEISNIFKNYFSSIASKAKLNISFSHKHYSHFLKNRSNISFFVSRTDKTEIENVISSLDSNKSIGPNSIPTKILKLLKNDISSQLSEIFNISFSSGILPLILKAAKNPIHKNNSKLDFSNYDPISLLSNIEKILERLMYNRMYKFFFDNIIYPVQFGLDKNIQQFMHSLVLQRTEKNLDKKNIGFGIFVDVQKAFDTVERDVLLSKLEHYGIHGLANEWFKYYLSNRKQYVSINGYDSNLADVKFGVPQGSVLGLLLFLVYINDLNQALKFILVNLLIDLTT